jgi:hypothetical protein
MNMPLSQIMVPDSLLIITDSFSSASYWEDKPACDSVYCIRKNLTKSNASQ